MTDTTVTIPETLTSELDAFATLLLNSVSTRVEPDLETANLHETEVHETRIDQLIQEHGYEPLGTGSGRRVYRTPGHFGPDSPFAVKIARPQSDRLNMTAQSGRDQNQVESETWTQLREEAYSDGFAPVFSTGDENRFIITAEYDTNTVENTHLENAKTRLENTVWRPEPRLENIGLDETGEAVFIDYGIQNEYW